MDHPSKMTPREYAVHRSKQTETIIAPQLIYYYVRKGDIVLEDCQCGRRVLDVELINKFFDEKDKR